MAAFATRAKPASMHVFRTVTTVAAGGQLDLLGNGNLVTGLAGQTGVRAVQFVIGLGVMVESPQGPVIRVVALGAGCSQGLLVNIIGLMTDRAFQRRTFEGRGEMTLLAWRDGMLADQRKPGEAMIKYYFSAPVTFIVATFTTFAFLAIVLVVALVTGKTFRGEFVAIDIALVAGVAGDFLVFALESESGFDAMIERHFGPAGHSMAILARVTITTLVSVIIGVAGNAGGLQLLFVEISAMTAVTAHFGMQPFQRILGMSVVIETYFRPFFYTMTGLALVAITAVVDVVNTMAADTVSRNLFVTIIGMTCCTTDGLVTAP